MREKDEEWEETMEEKKSMRGDENVLEVSWKRRSKELGRAGKGREGEGRGVKRKGEGVGRERSEKRRGGGNLKIF